MTDHQFSRRYFGAGGRPAQVLRHCETDNIVALADVEWVRKGWGLKL